MYVCTSNIYINTLVHRCTRVYKFKDILTCTCDAYMFLCLYASCTRIFTHYVYTSINKY